MVQSDPKRYRLFYFHGFVKRHSQAFEFLGSGFLVADVDFPGELSDFQGVAARDDYHAVAVGYYQIPRINHDAGAIDGEIVGLRDCNASVGRSLICNSVCGGITSLKSVPTPY